MGTGDHEVIGRPEYRVEGAEKVTGAASYTADLHRAGELQVGFLGSPHPHARIVSVDVSRALAVGGVVAVLTGEDVRPRRLGRRLQDWPLLAWDRVRFAGDRVVAVAAETRGQAEAALWEIDVEYDVLPTLLDPATALDPDAPVLHPEPGPYRYLGADRPPVGHPNLQGEKLHEHGDVDAAFADAEHVFDHTFDVPRTFTGYLEPRASLVWTEGELVHIVTTNKSPFRLRDQLAVALELDPEKVVVDAGYIGGDFGGKGLSIEEHVLVLLAQRTGRPVRSVSRYPDDVGATTTRHAARIRLRTGTDANGRILAHEADVLFDGGAYAAGKPNVDLMPGKAMFTMAGYHIPSARLRARSVYTNTVPGGNARAPGQPQNAFAAESHVDLIARALGIPPLDFRLLNAIRPGQVGVTGERRSRSAMVQVLETLRATAGDRSLPVGHGRGVALGARPSASGSATVVVTVTTNGKIDILTGVPDQGGGAATAIQRMASEELGVPPARVRVRRGTTAEAPFDAGVGGSRVTTTVGGAAVEGMRVLRRHLDDIAPGRPVAEQIDRAAARGGVRVLGEFEHRSDTLCTNAYMVEVSVDRETGRVQIVDCLLVADVGALINPVAARGQLLGGFVSGLGQALMEELTLEDGVITSANLDTYKMPTTCDTPPVRLVVVTDHAGDGPFGAKSVGELTNSAVAPALANAIEDALGVRLWSLPLTGERVWAALERAG